MDKILNCKQIDELSAQDRQEYLDRLRRELLTNAPINTKSITQNVLRFILPIIRNYDLCVEGAENIPRNSNCIFAMNHSNSHDFPTMQEVFIKLGISPCFIASNEGLSPAVFKLFKECGAIFFNRFDKAEAKNALMTMTSNMVNGRYGAIFPESTWNLHPYKPMHLVKIGAVYSSAIADVPIIPVIFEYIETEELCKRESELFRKCVVTFGKPLIVKKHIELLKQTEILQSEMEQLRRIVWDKYKIKKSNFNKEDILRYLNHTYLKKYGGLAQYDSIREGKILLVKDQLSAENDYHLDNNGLFVPGNLSKEEGKKYIN